MSYFVPVFVALAFAVYFNLPKQFPDRLAVIPSSFVDNEIYHQADWWNPNSIWAILRLMNSARVPYFVNILKVNKTSTSKYIDLGCGGGLLTEEIALAGYDVTGIDRSDNSLKHAREHALSSKVYNVNYVVGSVYELPFESESVDGVIISDVLEHLHDLRLVISEIKRVLKPNGVLVFDTISRTVRSYLVMYLLGQEILGFGAANLHDWNMFITPDEMKQLLIEAGFSVGSDWKGIGPVINPLNAYSKGYLFNAITRFQTTEDLSETYAGWGVKL